jgi:NDP-sugar pyrophosphorylase family protein
MTEMMQAIILAGGLGTRLRRLTSMIPKSMVTILGRPFLAYQLELLKSYEITDIVLSIGYLGDQIRDYFGNGSRMGLRLTYSFEEKPMGTGGGIKSASHLLKDEFFVIYGDSYLPIDYREVQDFFKKSSKMGLLVAYDNKRDDTAVPSNVCIDENMFVTNYNKSFNYNTLDFVEAGVLAFKKTILNFIPNNKTVSLEQEIFPALITQRELISFITNQRFYDIGSSDRLRKFEDYLHDYIKNTF